MTGALNDTTLMEYMERGKQIVRPFSKKNLQPASIDLRLGCRTYRAQFPRNIAAGLSAEKISRAAHPYAPPSCEYRPTSAATSLRCSNITASWPREKKLPKQLVRNQSAAPPPYSPLRIRQSGLWLFARLQHRQRNHYSQSNYMMLRYLIHISYIHVPVVLPNVKNS